MIDENKIEQAASEQASLIYYDNPQINHGILEDVFKSGINWFKDNLWHPMSDEPERGSEILIERDMEVWHKHHPGLNINRTTVYEYDFHDNWGFYAHDDKYKRWLYLTDLL